MAVQKEISKSVLKRAPVYLSYLRAMPETAPDHISATALAQALGMGEVQVRKDLALVSSGGRPKIGYPRDLLVHDIEEFLGYGDPNDAVLIGAGIGPGAAGLQRICRIWAQHCGELTQTNLWLEKFVLEKPFCIYQLEEFCKVKNIKNWHHYRASRVCPEVQLTDCQWNSGNLELAPTHLDVPELILPKMIWRCPCVVAIQAPSHDKSVARP